MLHKFITKKVYIMVCCFIGHRKINNSLYIENKLNKIIEELIINKNVNTFLFGSKSEFDSLCLKIVINLKEKYHYIKTIAYTCKSESATLTSEKQKQEKLYSYFFKKDIHLLYVDEEYEHEKKYTSGKASYVERNYAMIEDSDYCIFYYNKNYLPKRRKFSKQDILDYQPKSGTKIAYDFAIRKRKNIINVFELFK